MDNIRTLLRVLFVEKDGVWFVLPAFGARVSILLYNENIPSNILKLCDTGKRFHCKMPIDQYKDIGELMYLDLFDWEEK